MWSKVANAQRPKKKYRYFLFNSNENNFAPEATGTPEAQKPLFLASSAALLLLAASNARCLGPSASGGTHPALCSICALAAPGHH